MHFDVQDLALIEAIHQSGSFSAAAQLLFRTRAAITQHVQKLESQVGFLIFDRSHYRSTLTPEGKLFLERGQPLLRYFDRLKAETQYIKQGWESDFSIAVDDVLDVKALFPLIHEFRQTAPHVTIHVLREVLNGCWDALVENRAGLVIGASAEPPPHLLHEERPLGSVEFVFAVAKDHPLTHLSPPLRPEDLELFPRIVIADTSRAILKRSTGMIAHQTQIIVPTMEEKIQAQVYGLGIGYLPRPRVQSLLEKGLLMELDLTHHVKKKGYFKIAWRRHSESKVLAWFLKALESQEARGRFLGK